MLVRVMGLGCCSKQSLSVTLPAADIILLVFIFQEQFSGFAPTCSPRKKTTPLTSSGVVLCNQGLKKMPRSFFAVGLELTHFYAN